MTQAMIRFFIMVLGNTMDSHKSFMDHLTISRKFREVYLMKECDVTIAFVPIVSRAGTDISAALEKIPQDKPVILVILHHTFDLDYVAPDSRLCVNKDKVFAVDCLYHEDHGLLRCLRNDDAIRAVKNHLRSEDHDDDAVCIWCMPEEEPKCQCYVCGSDRVSRWMWVVAGISIVIILLITLGVLLR